MSPVGAGSSSKGLPHWLPRDGGGRLLDCDADGHLHHRHDGGGGHLLHGEAHQAPPHWQLEQNALIVASASVRENMRMQQRFED